MQSPEALLKTMHDGVVAFEEDNVRKAAGQWIDAGLDPVSGIMNGLVAGMNTVGQLFKKQEYFVPEVLLCAETMNAGVEVIKPHMGANAMKSEGVIVLGTIQGDIHDLGKNLVRMMLEVGGFTVHDLGVNVTYEEFAEAAVLHKADLVGISAMMTTTMMGMKQAIPIIKARRPEIRVLVGGAPVTPAVLKIFQADGYAASAVDIVEEAKRVLAQN